jgi:hypothetical protein
LCWRCSVRTLLPPRDRDALYGILSNASRFVSIMWEPPMATKPMARCRIGETPRAAELAAATARAAAAAAGAGCTKEAGSGASGSGASGSGTGGSDRAVILEATQETLLQLKRRRRRARSQRRPVICAELVEDRKQRGDGSRICFEGGHQVVHRRG